MITKILLKVTVKVKTNWNKFSKSILFLPILFTIGSFGLLLITSTIDETFDESFTIDVDYLDPLIFAGGPDAARSVLSAIAGGWATILGVAFSVTLISLQLSVSKYISHLVNRFEQDNTNRFVLGWFIFTVTYSLLVLKTVRTGEPVLNVESTMNGSNVLFNGMQQVESTAFTPILGVNVAVGLAIVSLFLLVLYLHNISSYLKPIILISKLIKQIFSALKPYENRSVYEKDTIPKSMSRENFIMDLKSNQHGVLTYIDWESISKSLTEYGTKHEKNLWMDCNKTIGDWIEKQDTLAKLYEFNPQISNDKSKNINYANYEKDKNQNIMKSEDFEDFEQNLLSGLEISTDRDLSRDPLFGTEVLRSVAVKGLSLGDTDVVKSCITGLFRILHHSYLNKGIIGIPFTISTDDDKKNVNKKLIEKKDYKKDSGKSLKKSINKETTTEKDEKIESVIRPKEVLLDTTLLTELNIIIDSVNTSRHTSLFRHITNEYISLASKLIRDSKKEEFELLSDWYISQLQVVIKKFPLYMCLPFINPLIEFQNELESWEPVFAESMKLYVKDISGYLQEKDR